MKGPSDFEDTLTPDDEVLLEDLEKDLEEWFTAKHEEYHVNTNCDERPERVWREFVKRASKAGWDASMRGAKVEIKKPRG